MNQPISPTPNSDAVLVATPEPPAHSVSQAEVYVYVGLDTAAKYSIEHGEYIIGRDPSSHIVLDVDGVSRRHARLTFSTYELIIEDLESANGVFIEGVQVQLPTRVRPEQEVQIGSARLTIRLSDETARQLSAALWDQDLGLGPVRAELAGEKYKVLTTVARGGMGVIMQARDLRIRRTVAMKVMKTGAQFSRENVLRFIDEAQLTGQLEHPNIVPVYELGIDGSGETFYTMKFVKGITLDVILRGLRTGDPEMKSRYSLGDLLTVFQKVADAVAYAHSRGVVHRDLKPENIMIGSYGELLVMDWGLAKQMEVGREETPEIQREPLPKIDSGRRGFETLHGVVVGTPPYISPEQARGELEKINERSDIYVLGAILYSILTLRPPVLVDNVEAVLDRIISGQVVPPLRFNKRSRRTKYLPPGSPAHGILLDHCPNGRIPEGLAAVALKALQVEPADRYQSVQEMQADISAYQGGFATKAEQASPWRQLVLFSARHKREMTLLVVFVVVLQVLSISFAIQTNSEKNRVLASELKVREGQIELAKLVEELRGTAPVYAQEASSLLEKQKPEEALEKIDYALEQVPNQAEYHYIRGNILQTLLRFNEAEAAYQEVLRRNPRHRAAKDNLQLTRELIAKLGDDGQPSPAQLRSLHSALVNQKRVGDALYVLNQIGRDKKVLFETWKAAFEKRGFRQRFETREDQTLNIDLSKTQNPDLNKLRGVPVSGLNLDDAKINDISALKGLALKTLSLNRTQVTDLSPISGMPLRSLQLDGSPANTIAALARLPLESLRLSGMRIDRIDALRGMRLEQLNLAGCRRVDDISPLTGMPLQTLDLSRTGISDLSPLVSSPLRELNLEGCADVTDLLPLMEIKTLERLQIPAHCKDIEFLRDHPSLKRLSYKKMTEPVYDFWAAYDARNDR